MFFFFFFHRKRKLNKRIYFGSQFEDTQSILVEKAWRQGLGWPVHHISIQKVKRENCSSASLLLCSFKSTGQVQIQLGWHWRYCWRPIFQCRGKHLHKYVLLQGDEHTDLKPDSWWRNLRWYISGSIPEMLGHCPLPSWLISVSPLHFSICWPNQPKIKHIW